MFENIIGNDGVKEILRRALSQKKISNTILFQGPVGVGKSLFAKELAKQLILPIGKQNENKINHDSHPDFHIYSLSDSNKVHSIQSMRDMIDDIHKPPYEGKAKVFIIDHAEKMLESSSNAILKTLEEPNLDSYIILLSSKPNELLPTIQSRCFKVRFSTIDTHEIASYLETFCEKSKGVSDYIAKMAAGSIGRAHLLANDKNIETVIEELLNILKRQHMPTIDDIDVICKDLDPKGPVLDMIFSLLLMWFSDQNYLSLGINSRELFFKNSIPDSPVVVPLENVHYFLDKIKEGVSRNIKLSNCLYNFFLDIYQFSY